MTVGEATLSGEARLLCCDGVTSGLDGGTALRLVARLLQRAAASGAAAIFSLQSPTIEGLATLVRGAPYSEDMAAAADPAR